MQNIHVITYKDEDDIKLIGAYKKLNYAFSEIYNIMKSQSAEQDQDILKFLSEIEAESFVINSKVTETVYIEFKKEKSDKGMPFKPVAVYEVEPKDKTTYKVKLNEKIMTNVDNNALSK